MIVMMHVIFVGFDVHESIDFNETLKSPVIFSFMNTKTSDCDSA